MEEYDKQKSHISSKLYMIYIYIYIYISSNNGRHTVTKTSIQLHYTSPNYTSLYFTNASFFWVMMEALFSCETLQFICHIPEDGTYLTNAFLLWLYLQ